jgi:hypothetical protein
MAVRHPLHELRENVFFDEHAPCWRIFCCVKTPFLGSSGKFESDASFMAGFGA